jgi:lipid-A-disaccharide synthase
MSPREPLKIMLAAGESSGDRHAAALADDIRRLAKPRETKFFGCAGPRMRDAGVEAVVRADELSIVGLLEIAQALPIFLRARRRLLNAAESQRPDVAVLVDFPDFNLRMAKALKRRGIKVAYYISPQLWAWRSYRLLSVRQYVDRMLTILPFEQEWYRQRGFEKVSFVGNPLAGSVAATTTRAEWRARHGVDQEKPLLSLLPGSRRKEIARILPLMLRSAAIVREKRDDIRLIVPLASEAHVEMADQIINSSPLDVGDVLLVSNETYDALNASDAAAITSGTATLEAGLIGTPMAIVYKTSWLNYSMLSPLITVEHYGLVNLVAGERIARELIQDEFTADGLADELLRLLQPNVNKETRSRLARLHTALELGSAGISAASEVIALAETQDR